MRVMPVQFTCSCGAMLYFEDDADDVPIVCPQCQKIYASSRASKFPPLSQSIPAKIAAWGCLLPLSLVLILFALNGYLAQELGPAALAGAAGALLLALFGWLLKQHRYTRDGILIVLAVIVVVLVAAGVPMATVAHQQAQLNDKFASILDIAAPVTKMTPHIPDATPELRARCLPVILNERGVRNKARVYSVCGALLEAIPPEARAVSAQDVHSVIYVNWWYKLIGSYVTTDGMKTKMSNIYHGGCTLKLIDLDSRQVIQAYELHGPDTAPQTRPGEDVTDWYGAQPLDTEILEKIRGIRFKAK